MAKYLLDKYEIIKEEKNNKFHCYMRNNHGEDEFDIYRISKDKVNNISAISFKEFENLNHEHILNFQVEQDNSFYYFVRKRMEEYSNVNDIQDLKGFFTCFIQICDAISYLHSKNIAHGCLSYDSIKTSEYEDFYSYLLDIGYSYFTVLQPQATCFAAPEQKTRHTPYSREADIYSLAQIMLNVYLKSTRNTIIYNQNDIIQNIGGGNTIMSC